MQDSAKGSLLHACMLALVLILATSGRITAQTTTTGAITGAITDPQGKVVPGAAVSVINLGTNELRSIITGNNGEYHAPLLPVGEYRVEVSASGFAKFVRFPIMVRVTERVTVDAALQLRQVGDTVTVTEQAAMVQQASATLGGVVDPGTIVGLPLSTRNYTQIMTLSPGVAAGVPNAGNMGLNSVELSSQGGRGSDNSVEINGTDAMNMFTNTLGNYVGTQGVAVPAPDTLEEFKVQTGLFSAATGRSAGANVAVVTKSGTNALHGAVYEFLRNDALNANDFFFNRAGLQRPVLKQNQFGFTLGGPIQKDKLFFFTSYQGTRQRNGTSSDSQSTAFLPPLTDDRTPAGIGKVFGGQKAFAAFVSGGIGTAVASDGSNINPVALKLLNLKLPNGQYLIPSPKIPGSPSKFSESGKFQEDQFNANLDRQLGSNNRLSGKYFYSRQHSFFPLYQDIKSNVLPGFGAAVEGRNHNLSASFTHIFSPKLIGIGRFGFTRSAGVVAGDEPVKVSDIGMTTAPGIDTLPWTQVLGQFQIGATHNAQQGVETNLYNYAYTSSYIKGRHSMQFGVDVKRHRSLAFDPVNRHADLIFLDFQSFLLGQAAGVNGAPFSHVAGVVTFAGSFERDFEATDVGSFFQDDIRLTSRLSVNLGLRHEFYGGISDAQGRNANFDFRKAAADPPASGTFAGYVIGKDTPGNPPAGVIRADNNTLRDSRDLKNFSPRFGFAFQPFPGHTNVVLRGGYGVYFSRRSGLGLFQNVLAYPFSLFNAQVLQAGSTATFQNPLPPIPPASAFPLYEPLTPTSQLTFTNQDPVTGDPYIQTYSVNAQYEFAPNYLLEIGYVGSKGTHIIGNVILNQPLLASAVAPIRGITTNTVANAARRVPYLGLSTNTSEYMGAFDSSYNALEMGLTKRLSHGLQFTGAYTYSKSLDNAGAPTSGVFLSSGGLSGDQRDFSQARGLSSFDRKQRLIFGYVWQIPNIASNSSLVKGLLHDWQVTGILTVQSGFSITISDSAAATIFSRTNSRAQFAPGKSAKDADLTGSVDGRLSRYFDTSAFSTASPIGDGTGFGNSGRGILRGPDQRNLDFALMRRFKLNALKENSILEFRAEAFNLTNTPNFGGPGSDRAAASSFGVISGTTINPRIIQFALRVSF